MDARDGHAHALDRDGDLESKTGGPYVAAGALTWVLRTLYMRDFGFDLKTAAAQVVRHPSFEVIESRMGTLMSTLS